MLHYIHITLQLLNLMPFSLDCLYITMQSTTVLVHTDKSFHSQIDRLAATCVRLYGNFTLIHSNHSKTTQIFNAIASGQTNYLSLTSRFHKVPNYKKKSTKKASVSSIVICLPIRQTSMQQSCNYRHVH